LDKAMDNGHEEHQGPLRGLKVLDLGQLVAAPMSATLLADYGADVVKVERRGTGDPVRQLIPHKGPVSLWWKVSGRNKRSVAIDFTDPDDKALLLDLVAVADVVLENFVPGTLEAHGLGYDALKAVNPRVVMLSISGYGQTGPYRGRRAFGRSAEAFGGMAYMTGYEDRPPLHTGFPLADEASGVLGALAVMSAIYERDRNPSGEGQHIDLALYETVFRFIEFLAVAYDQLGKVTERMGFRNTYVAPVNTWQCRDGWVSFTGSTQAMVERLFVAIGRPELNDDPKFATNTERVANQDELDAILAGWMREHTMDEIVDIFDRHRVAISPILSIADIFENPQYAAREAIVTVDDDEVGPLRMQGIFPKFSRTPGHIRHAGPPLDADRADVQRDWLGRP
jgi:crotonobetainyl-CoA:carnitine CoA-transferase CaiB-like acyl-CoA transferase